MMPASPAQNASGEIPVLGVASLAMKSNSSGAIFNPWASTRFMMGFLGRKPRFYESFQDRKQQKARQRAISGALLAISRVDEKAQTGLKKSQILAARSTRSSNRMPVFVSMRSISSVASGTERAEVSSTSSASVGG